MRCCYICCMFASSQSPRPARIAVSTFFFMAGICFASWASRIPDIQHHLHLNDAGLGSVLFALPVGSMLSLPFSGMLVAKLGSRFTMIGATLLYAALLCSIGFVDATWQLVTALFFFGVAGNMMNISMNTQAVGVEALYGRSVMASFHGLWSLAGFSGAAIGSLMIAKTASPLLHFLLIAVLVLLLVLIVNKYALRNDTRQGNTSFKIAWPHPSLMKLGIISFCCMACEGCMFDWSGIYFREEVHAPQNLVTLGYTVFMATMASGRFVADWLVTKTGVKNTLRLSGTLISVGLLSAVIFPNIYAATAGFFLTGLGVSSVVPLIYGLAGKSKFMNASMAIAAVSTVGYLGFLFGPPLIGYISQASSLRWSFAVMAVLGFGTALLASKAETVK